MGIGVNAHEHDGFSAQEGAATRDGRINQICQQEKRAPGVLSRTKAMATAGRTGATAGSDQNS